MTAAATDLQRGDAVEPRTLDRGHTEGGRHEAEGATEAVAPQEFFFTGLVT